VQNPHEQAIYRFQSLEQVRSQEQQRRRSLAEGRPLEEGEGEKPPEGRVEVSRLITQLYTVSYLILFSILGTLARLGLQALPNYPGTPIGFPSIWPNFAGSLVMGFLAEDRMLFADKQQQQQQQQQAPPTPTDEESGNSAAAAAKKAHAAVKKTIPLYIGLATGFCGSFTSFSAFMRDMFLALTNDLNLNNNNTAPRNGGYSFLALLAVPIITVSLSLGALMLGAHLAIGLAPLTPSLPRGHLRSALDKTAVFLGWGCWLGAVLLSIFPPRGHADWRGKVTFALVFAPLGCLVRFYASLKLNGRVAAFPVGTFVVNLAGTGVLAMAWDLAHSGASGGGGLVGCQVLAGVQDGFCGCLTTVSTWVGELAALRRRHAYVYGGASVLGGLAVVVAIMGGLRWSGSYYWEACG
jgi:fluoride ion exporter CrcB/FEX